MARAADALPELSFADAEAIVREPVHALRALGHGSRARVFRVETAEGVVRVVRLSAKGAGRVEREAWVRGRLKRHPDVPLLAELRVRDVPLDAVVDVVTMAELPGISLAVAHETLAEPALCALWKRAGECFGAVHETLVASFGLLDGAGHGPYPRWRDAFASIAGAALEEARVAGLEDLASRARPQLDACAAGLDPTALARLTHGDPQPGNLQVHRGALVALLDWEFAQGADPDYELAGLESSFEAPAGALRRAHFYEGYCSRREPWAPAPLARRRAYRLAHALRASEYLTAEGPGFDPESRSLATREVRGRIARWLDDPAE